MTMPLDLVLVRHGESEGNRALRLSKAGDHSMYTDAFKLRHSSRWRLTGEGERQAETAGAWLKNHGLTFDRHYTSHCTRAIETAAMMALPNARWFVEMYLREREWGHFDCSSMAERATKIEAFQRRAGDDFYWKPEGGESMADLCLRLDRVLDTLHRECGDRRVLIVCHGEVMWGLRIRLERMTQADYHRLDKSKDPAFKINNCQILHYTRRDPFTNELGPYLRWARSIDPIKDSTPKEWREINRRTFSNAELRSMLEEMDALEEADRAKKATGA